MSRYATTDLCDEYRADRSGAFRVLPPAFAEFGGAASFAGLVSTVRCFEDNALVRTALESPGRGRVLVIDGGGSRRSALVGGKLAALAVENGWAGLLVDGCVRDAAELVPCPIGIRALALCPVPPSKQGAGERDVPVQVQGVRIRPGDWLCADVDGIVLLDAAPAAVGLA